MTAKTRKRRARRVKTRSPFVRREDLQDANVAFVYALDRAIAAQTTTTIGVAVKAALTEVRDCFVAYIC